MCPPTKHPSVYSHTTQHGARGLFCILGDSSVCIILDRIDAQTGITPRRSPICVQKKPFGSEDNCFISSLIMSDGCGKSAQVSKKSSGPPPPWWYRFPRSPALMHIILTSSRTALFFSRDGFSQSLSAPIEYSGISSIDLIPVLEGLGLREAPQT